MRTAKIEGMCSIEKVGQLFLLNARSLKIISIGTNELFPLRTILQTDSLETVCKCEIWLDQGASDS